MGDAADTTMLDLTAQIVVAHVENNQVTADALPQLIQSVYRALATASAPEMKPADAPASTPAVPIKRSVFPDYIICLEDGKKLKVLKGHLRARYNLSTAQYRIKWGLPADYPMVAPNYAATRSNLAKKIRLGHIRKINGGELEATGAGYSGRSMLPTRRARSSRG